MGLLRLTKHCTLLFQTSTPVYACVSGCHFGQNSTFLQFSGARSALLSQPKAKLRPSVPRTSFLEPCSCFLQHFSRSFPGSVEHKCSKPRKTRKKRKIRVFSRKCYLFCSKALRRVSLHLQQNITDLHQRFPVEKGAFSKISPTMSHLSDASGHRGCTFTTLFLHIQTR